MTSAPFNDTTTFTPTFTPEPKETTKGIVTRSRTNRRPQVKETPTDDLFETNYVPTDDGLVNRVKELMTRHKAILSVTKDGSKVMQATFLRLKQLVSGEFLFAYTWDRQWFNKIVDMEPVSLMKFDDIDQLLRKVDDVLDYVEERQKYGYWYPSNRNGRPCRTSLADFLAHPMRSGNWWSPFVELACGDAVTPSMYRTALGDSVCAKLDKILEHVWFGKDFDTTVKFYKGVMDLKKWHGLNGYRLRKFSPENNYNLASFDTLLDRIQQCNEETFLVGPTFIGPWANKWCVFKSWMEKVHGVTI